MTWKKDKWIGAAIVFGVMAWWIGLHTTKPHHIEEALVAAWFCGADFTAWCAVHNPPKSEKGNK